MDGGDNAMVHYGPEQKKTQQKYPCNHSLFHEHGSEWTNEQMNKRTGARQRSKQCQESSAEQANE